jgi:hypothetical protein
MDKVQNPVILSVIYHCQDLLEFYLIVVLKLKLMISEMFMFCTRADMNYEH